VTYLKVQFILSTVKSPPFLQVSTEFLHYLLQTRRHAVQTHNRHHPLHTMQIHPALITLAQWQLKRTTLYKLQNLHIFVNWFTS